MSNRFSFASGSNADFIDGLYSRFQQDPLSVDDTWRKFFEGFEFGLKGVRDVVSTEDLHNHARIHGLIDSYRRHGHRSCHLNPLSAKPSLGEELSLRFHGLDSLSKDSVFSPLDFGGTSMSLGEIEAKLQRTYTGTVGVEFLEVDSSDACRWLLQKIEAHENKPKLSAGQKKRALEKVAEAEGFEKFLHTRFIGQKRFSVEGLDVLIPFLDHLTDCLVDQGAEEVNLGMAHRGRLNVLINYMGKSFEKLVKEFEGAEWSGVVDGDVKYHMGYSSNGTSSTGKIVRKFLAANPSHLEAVNPVLEGFTRSRQEIQGDVQRKKIIPILMHGDAAFIGQGVVAETLNMSGLNGYTTGGTIHVITNNMIGFTTEWTDSRTSYYSSDMARILRAPVFHVNADDVDSALWVAELAAEYRQKFGKDVVVDLVGYRRHGHNEGEEPSFTQPLMYKSIAKHPTLFQLYSENLVRDKIVGESEAKALFDSVRDKLQAGLDKARNPEYKIQKAQWPKEFQQVMESPIVSEKEVFEVCSTSVADKELKDCLKMMTQIPAGFQLHPKAKKVIDSRSAMLNDAGVVDWATGELLALATLAKENRHVRFSGQDAKRGTFTSRHSVFFDYENEKPLEILNQVGGARVDVINSPLSEAACIGFEWGYSLANRDSLVVWEAQFGDFCNGGQIPIDQYLVASEAKWKQTSGMVLLLPHGYEGQGPEHSNARPERFLQLCGENNMTVAIPSTPAQHFHLLRRQLVRNFRKPLVIMSPKSLLRDPDVISKTAEFTQGQFHTLLDDPSAPKSAKGVIFSAGKIYYELKRELEKSSNQADVALVRVEQLYPFDHATAKKILSRYKSAKNFVWAQEEPLNMGGWMFVRDSLEDATEAKLKGIGRPKSGTTAEGSTKAHLTEQTRILKEAILFAAGKS